MYESGRNQSKNAKKSILELLLKVCILLKVEHSGGSILIFEDNIHER